MNKPQICATLYVRLPVAIHNRLQDRVKSTGEAKTDVVIAALEMYLRNGERAGK